MTEATDTDATTERTDTAAVAEQRPLLPDTAGFLEQWSAVQGVFVDEPKQAVKRADALVGDVIEQLSRGFAEQRRRLEAEWGEGKEVSTEDLRIALQRYREFFQALLRT